MTTPVERYQNMQGTPKTLAAPTKRLFGPPHIPVTPSKTINNMLQKHCGQPLENPVKAAVTYYVCFVFQVSPDKYAY